MYDPLKAKTRVALSVAVSFLAGLGLASQFGFTESAASAPAQEPETTRPTLTVQTGPRVSPEAVQPALDLSEAFVNIADAVTPAVVLIEATRQRARRTSRMEQFFNDRPRNNVPDIVPVGGSGFIISKNGYVMTNNHVVENAVRITVSLQDGRKFGAEVVGTDPTTDIAVIKIDGEGLPTASLGSSAEVEVGEWVLAIGNPGFAQSGPPSPDLDYTVTAGIVSALGRSLALINQSLRQDPEYAGKSAFAIEDFIQTDAVINSGNSGGPLVNLRGQVIGVNAAIVSRTGVYQGYGFAIPIDLAHRVMEDLVAHGRVRRAYLGVSIDPVGEADAERFELPEVAGALVQNVTRNTPAERAGLADYDVITALDGEKVLTGNDLQHKIALKAPGDRVNLTLYRDGQPRDITVQLDEAPFTDEAVVARPTVAGDANQIGVVNVVDITPELVREFDLESTDGVMVWDVQEGGPAVRRGLRPGCLVREVDGRAIDDSDDWDRAFRGVAEGDVVSVIAACNPPEAGETVYRIYNIRAPR